MGMAKEWRLEDPGEGIHEAEILAVKAAAGTTVEDGDVVLEIETDKAAMELPAPFTGTIEEVRVSEGDVVEVGDVLLTYREDGATEEAEAKGSSAAEPDEGEEETEETEAPKRRDTGTSAVGELPSWEDEQEPARERSARPTATERPIPASPAARRAAREGGVDLASIRGSGPGGRITVADARAAAQAKSERGAGGFEEIALPDFERWGEIERVPFRSVRRAVARRMVQAWKRIPHVTHNDVADIGAIEELRKEYASKMVDGSGGDLSLTVFAIKAVASALDEFPRFNASLDEAKEEIVLKRYHDIGVAVDTERGLLVPVVRNVNAKSLAQTAIELADLARRARSGEIEAEEMRGGTFTITNVGPLGGTGLSPLIRWPEVAILGLARARLEPVAVGDDPTTARILARLRLPLCLAFDHRVNDGADAARFVSAIVRRLSDPASFVLNL